MQASPSPRSAGAPRSSRRRCRLHVSSKIEASALTSSACCCTTTRRRLPSSTCTGLARASGCGSGTRHAGTRRRRRAWWSAAAAPSPSLSLYASSAILCAASTRLSRSALDSATVASAAAAARIAIRCSASPPGIAAMLGPGTVEHAEQLFRGRWRRTPRWRLVAVGLLHDGAVGKSHSANGWRNAGESL